MAQYDPVQGGADTPLGEALKSLGAHWGWFVALGILLVLLGAVATVYVLVATLASVLFVGAFMLVGGIAQLVHAWRMSGWKLVMWWTLIGILYCVAGGLVLYNPVGGAAILTLLLGATLIGIGALRLWIWFQNRSQPGWKWLAFSSIISLIAGVLIAIGWPANSLWILGFLLAIDLLFHGWMLIMLGLTLRNQRQLQTT